MLPRIAISFGSPSFAQLMRAVADCIILNAGLALAFLLRLLWAMMYEQDQFGDLEQTNTG